VHVCGAMTVEGAPHLGLSTTWCSTAPIRAARSASAISRSTSHIRMMRRRSHSSRVRSPRHHMPNDATVEDCKSAYLLSWKLALKANALYRDGSKLSQPLQSQLIADEEDEDDAPRNLYRQAAGGAHAIAAERVVEKDRRAHHGAARTREAAGPRKGYTRRPWSAGIRCICAPANTKTAGSARSSSTCTRRARLSGRCSNNFAIAISLGLQYGVPLEEYVDAFTFTRLNPGASPGQRHHQVRHLDPRLRVPGARDLLHGAV